MCIPHARGDGPRTGPHASQIIAYSPRTWGWTEAQMGPPGFVWVFPTHVGMDRCRQSRSRRRRRIPHARGDGPQAQAHLPSGDWYSPRTWGWTGCPRGSPQASVVFPTHVGMDRETGVGGRVRRSIPHARGDGPAPQARLQPPAQYSPRTWGWTEPGARGSPAPPVFPTHVGMDRRVEEFAASRIGIPHARGDGPRAKAGDWLITGVFPTHVGMDRRLRARRKRARGIPHARGDGPTA